MKQVRRKRLFTKFFNSEAHSSPIARRPSLPLRLIRLIGVIVPQRLRLDWRQEWESELQYREALLAEWERLDWKNKVDLLRRSTSAFWDALWLLPRRWEDEMIQDLRFGVRMLLKNPAFSIIAVLTLALGIGANTAIFSVVYAVLLRPLPYHQPEQLVMLWTKQEKIGVEQTLLSEAEILDLREQAKLFEGFAVLNGNPLILSGNGEPEQLNGAPVSSNFFSLLGTKVFIGRDFTPAEEQPGAPRVAILNYGFWKRRFGGDQSVIGSTINLSGWPTTVVGVLPPNFELMLPSETQEATDIQVWVPYAEDYAKQQRHHHTLTTIARMKPGVSLPQAQAEMDAIAARLLPLHYTNTGFAVKVSSLHADIVKKMRPALLILLAAVSFVLLIACANVANLLLGRASARAREIAVRAALGAGRIRIIRQLLTESVLLALLGGVLGILLAVWGVKALLALSPADLPRLDEVSINIQVLAFTGAVTMVTGILFGLFPALRASQINLAREVKDGSRSLIGGGSSRRLRNSIVVVEIALSLVLLIGAGLLLRSFVRLTKVDPGFVSERILTVRLMPPRLKYKNGIAVGIFYQQLMERIQALPGVESAAAISDLPLTGRAASTTLTFEGVSANAERGDRASFDVDERIITPDYFKTMKTPLVAGRFFGPQDVRGQPRVAIIDETLARRLWPNASPVGRRLTYGHFPEQPQSWIEIIGVVKRIRHQRLEADVREVVYFSHAQASRIGMTLVMRTNYDPAMMVNAARSAVQAVDQDQPIYDIHMMDELVAAARAPARFTLLLLLLFAGVAGMLSVVGIYGVMSYAITQRTNEIGIRMALGARADDVLRLVIRQGMQLVLMGVAGGLVGAVLLTRLMREMLFGISATDPLTFSLIAVLLTIVAGLACYFPARRATKVDPIIALREQ
jgi:putative ABC transport system permease protein